jgi:hypothetical protein
MFVPVISIITGCSTMVTDNEQTITIITRCLGTTTSVKASCNVSNDKSHRLVNTPGVAAITRSSAKLVLDCKRDSKSQGTLSVEAKENSKILYNFPMGGFVGVVVDLANDANFDYPRALTVDLNCQ